MPPKGVDKSKQKEKEKIAVDKTFGLKNKNKSKVVQKYIKAIQQNAVGAPKGGKEEAERKEKESKQKDLAKSALMNSLFNMATDRKGRAFDPAAKKAAKQQEEEALAAGGKLKDEVRKEVIEGIANSIRLTDPKKGIRMSELGGHPIIQALKTKHADTFKILSLLLFIKANKKVFWVDDEESTNPTIRCQEDVDAEVDPDERPIEEIIEERRAALPPGGTPVNLDTFNAWKERREAQRLAKVDEERKESEKRGKGPTGMTGRDLFTFNAALFVDDDGAASEGEYEERDEGFNERPDDGREEDAASEEDDEEKAEQEEEEAQEGDEEDDDDSAAPEAELEDPGNAASSSGARGSAEAAPRQAAESGTVPINEQLFLEGDDLPDDLDDLDDDESK